MACAKILILENNFHQSAFTLFAKFVALEKRRATVIQNAPHNFLYIPQLWEICTASVHPTAELQNTCIGSY